MKRSTFAWTMAAAAVATVLAVAVAIGRAWNAMGAVRIGTAGWLAMGFGILATLALGIGLMGLAFYSSRHGYDDAAGGDHRAGAPEPGPVPADSNALDAERHRHRRKAGN